MNADLEYEIESATESESVTCTCCDSDFPTESAQATEYDGQVCESCLGDEYVSARHSRLGDSTWIWVRRDDATYIEDDDEWVTDSYRDRFYTWVSDPSNQRYVSDDHTVEIHGRSYSQSYAAENFYCCEACSDYIDQDDAYSRDSGVYCSSCDPGDDDYDSPDDSSVIKSYSADALHYVPFKGQPKDRTYYGIELEVECESGSLHQSAEFVSEALDGHAILKSDGSLSHGFEIVTGPATVAIHRDAFTEFLSDPGIRRMVRQGELASYKPGTCGIHVHISRDGLTPLQIGKMLCFLHNPDNESFIDIIAQRTATHFCRRHPGKKVTDNKRNGAQEGRYTALNLENAATVELRIFRGTLKLSSFLKSLEFTEALVHFTRPGVVSIPDSSRFQAFLHFVMQPSNAKQWPNLVEFLRAKSYLPKAKQDTRQAPLAMEFPVPALVESD